MVWTHKKDGEPQNYQEYWN